MSPSKSNPNHTPARRWQAIRSELAEQKVQARQSNIHMTLKQKQNKVNKNKKVNQTMKKKGTMPTPTGQNGGSQSTPVEKTAATPSRHVSPLTDLMAPRKSTSAAENKISPVAPKAGMKFKKQSQQAVAGPLVGQESSCQVGSEVTNLTPTPSEAVKSAQEGRSGDTTNNSTPGNEGQTNPTNETAETQENVNKTTALGQDNSAANLTDEAHNKADGAAVSGTKDVDIAPAAFKAEEEGMTATQKMRAVEIKQAREEYEEVRALYNIIKERVDDMQAKRKKGAIDKQLWILMKSCEDLNQAMLDAENELLNVLNGSNPEVIFVPSVFTPAPPPTPAPIPVVKKIKRKQSQVQDSGKPDDQPKRKKMNVNDYILDEAVEDNKEGKKDIGAGSSKRRKYQTPKYVLQEDMAEDGKGVVIHAVELSKKGKEQEAKEGAEAAPERKKLMPEIFRKGTKPDLARILNEVTRDEANDALYFREQLMGLTFNWGEVMGDNVCNIIRSWRFDKTSMGGKPKAAALAPHADYIKALIDDHDLMEKRLKSSPRLMQLSSLDPFFNQASIDWKLLEESADFVSNKDKNGVFRALHAMCCRKGDSPTWTEDTKIKGDLKNGYMVIHNILAESLEHIAYDVNHEDIDIDTTGDYSIPKRYVPMSQTLGWLYHQINMRTKSEDGRKDRVSSAGLGSLQRQFFLVLTGVMLVYESNLYNKEVDRIQRSGKKGVTQSEIIELKSIHKDQTCLRQLVNTKHRNVSKRLKGTITSKEPTSALAKTKDQERKIQNQVNSDLSRIRGDSIQAMALFFMYGTASFFHVWPTSREITQHDAAILINLASLLADRRWRAVKDKPHVFGDRAWNRLDALMHQALSKFLNHNGTFRTDINWPSATSFFSSKFDTVHLAHVFTLDVLMETHFPGLSRSIDGSVAPHVNLEDKEKWDIDGPATESFKALMTVNEGGGGHQEESPSESDNETDEDDGQEDSEEEEGDDEEDTSETEYEE
ncbi:hypothetical protein DFH28DRAFT_939964 [Melampsora americana]|nr:hypothetical protein DFH28DRAFT_939964 [Melampsora americana]